ncbi:MAG: Hpt domain-containing protein, partial [Myxococcales bacterium]|nr:Hpt domain-containing protein [Myxococcales bacterium]
MIESGRARSEPASGSRFDLIETPVAIALLDGTILETNRAFRTWTGSDAGELGTVLGIALPTVLAALTAGKPQVIKAVTKTERGRTMPVEYQLRRGIHDRDEVIVVEGRDLSRVHEKEAMLHAFAKTIEVNNRQLTHQHAEIEQLLAEVNGAYAAVKRLLDAADQGFATLDRRAMLLASRSAAFDRWFGTPPVGAPFADCLRRLNADVAAMFELFWAQLDLELLPLEILLEMLPAQLRAGHRWFRIAYKPALDPAGALLNLLVVISDVTDEIERERAEAQQTELANLLARYASDRAGFIQFVSEADTLVATITAPAVEPLELLRATHTLKGNCGLFGAQVIAARCHELEDHVAELGDDASVATRRTLGEDWRALRRRVGAFL